MSRITELLGDWKACARGTNYGSWEAVRYLLREAWLTIKEVLRELWLTVKEVLRGDS